MASNKTTIVVESGLAAAYNSAPQSKQKAARKAMQLALLSASDENSQHGKRKNTFKTRQKLPKLMAVRLSKKESELLTRINCGLKSEKQNRYLELRDKRESETLSENEEAELSQIVEELEDIWADRLQALISLARLRKTTPRQLMDQFQIQSASNGN